MDFLGEAWFADTKNIIGKTQDFYKGWSKGVFYSCNYAGQSATYNSYTPGEFLKNEEFSLFKKFKVDFIDEENKLKINEKIKTFLKISALAGDKLAIVQIAKWNIELSPEPNFENAYKWYNNAVALGIKTAKIKRDEMIENIEKQRLFEIQKESIKIFNKINNLGG